MHSAAPKHISLLAFCGANVLIDVEPLYFMVTRQCPIHRLFHTYIGATVAAAIVVACLRRSQADAASPFAPSRSVRF